MNTLRKILLQVFTPRFVIFLAAAVLVGMWKPELGVLFAVTFPGGLGALTYQSAFAVFTWAGGSWSTFTVTAAFTLLTTQMVTAGETFLTLTGAPGAGFAMTTPTAAQLIQQITQTLGFVPPVGFNWQFEVSNTTGQTATLTAGTGVTVNGTATVATTVNRTWLCTVTNNSPVQAGVTIQNLAGRSN